MAEGKVLVSSQFSCSRHVHCHSAEDMYKLRLVCKPCLMVRCCAVLMFWTSRGNSIEKQGINETCRSAECAQQAVCPSDCIADDDRQFLQLWSHAKTKSAIVKRLWEYSESTQIVAKHQQYTTCIANAAETWIHPLGCFSYQHNTSCIIALLQNQLNWVYCTPSWVSPPCAHCHCTIFIRDLPNGSPYPLMMASTIVCCSQHDVLTTQGGPNPLKMPGVMGSEYFFKQIIETFPHLVKNAFLIRLCHT